MITKMPYTTKIEGNQMSAIFRTGHSYTIRLTNDANGDYFIFGLVVRSVNKQVSFENERGAFICSRKAKKFVGNKEGVNIPLKTITGLTFNVWVYSAPPNLTFVTTPAPTIHTIHTQTPAPTPPAPVSTIPAHFIAEFMEMSLQLKREHNCPCCFDVVTKETINISKCGHIMCKGCKEIVMRTNPVCPTCRQDL